MNRKKVRHSVNQAPVISRYKINSDAPLQLRAALVSDLHDQSGTEAVKVLRSISPDLILIPGDIIETCDRSFRQLRKDEYQIYLRKIGKKATDPRFQSMYITDSRFPRISYVSRVLIHALGCIGKSAREKTGDGEAFLRECGKIAPCFFSRGNHDSLLERVPDGVKLLENEYVETEAAGRKIAIGGVSRRIDLKWLDAFAELPVYHILLCHYPEMYESLFRERNIELIVSGHAHGGQIRIGGKGIYASGQGLFPKYTKGIYENRLAVTTGLSDKEVIPRIGNPVEVAVLEL
ncbi:MAG: metallophosphoesterase [Clostridiales bacterium]|nr:metallophosphoesterase [Clostridiales bacterium]